MTNKNDEYFGNWDKDELASEVIERMKQWSDYTNSSGLRKKWMESYRLYFGKHFGDGDTYTDASGIADMGQTGEIKGVPTNHYRSIIQGIMSMTTSSKPTWQCRASNSDLKSLQQTKLGNQLLDSYMISKRFLREYKKAAESALVFGKGFVFTNWDKQRGRPYMVQQSVDPFTKEPRESLVFEGDVKVRSLSVFDYVTDPTLDNYEDRQWEIIVTWENKWDLIYRNPELKDDIQACFSKEHIQQMGQRMWYYTGKQDSDLIPVYHFFHKRSDSVTNGRYMKLCSPDAVLFDGPIPYKSLPVDRIVPGEIFGSVEGYTSGFDLIGLQNAYNVLVSSGYTNLQAFGVQSVLTPRSANLSSEMIGKSLSLLKYDPAGGEPKPLQLTAMPQGLFELTDLFQKSMETISGQNSVVRGDPDSSLKSGVALSLVQSMAIQYASQFQESWAALIEDGGTKVFELLQSFAKTERVAEAVGKRNKAALLSFKADDIDSITRVVVELGNPMSRTSAGRAELAQNLLQTGLIKTPQEYLQVVETGTLDPMLEGPLSLLDLIRQENELLMDGQNDKVIALVSDDHSLHMQEHLCILDNPLVRADSNIAQFVLAHIQTHMQLYKDQDPMWSMMRGQPPAPQPMMPPPGPPPEGEAPMPPMQPGPQG